MCQVTVDLDPFYTAIVILNTSSLFQLPRMPDTLPSQGKLGPRNSCWGSPYRLSQRSIQRSQLADRPSVIGRGVMSRASSRSPYLRTPLGNINWQFGTGTTSVAQSSRGLRGSGKTIHYCSGKTAFQVKRSQCSNKQRPMLSRYRSLVRITERLFFGFSCYRPEPGM